MNDSQRTRLLEHVPLADRPEANVYLNWSPEEQSFWLYRELRALRIEVKSANSRSTLKVQVAQLSASLLATLGLLVALVTGKVPMP